LRTSSLDLGEIPIRRLSDRDFYGQSAGKASRGTRHSSSPGKVGSDGRIELPVTIPEDLGGLHALELRSSDRVVARTLFAIETSIVSIRLRRTNPART